MSTNDSLRQYIKTSASTVYKKVRLQKGTSRSTVATFLFESRDHQIDSSCVPANVGRTHTGDPCTYTHTPAYTHVQTMNCAKITQKLMSEDS